MKKLLHWQTKNKVSNARLAELLGRHLSLIGRWHRGERKISLEDALKILELTGGEVPLSSMIRSRDEGE